MQSGEASDPRVEHPDRPPVHRADCTAAVRPAPLPRLPFAAVTRMHRGALVLLLALVAAVAAALLASGPAGAFSKQDLTITSADGTPLAATLDAARRRDAVGGWPALIFMHGLGADPRVRGSRSRRRWGSASATPCSPTTRVATASRAA